MLNNYCNLISKVTNNAMSSLEIELQDLRERNNELVKKVQYWKMTAAQKENEKLYLMKENNDLRLKLSRWRSGGAAHARKLDAEIQSASKQALSQLVQASSAVTRTVQIVKTYMQDRQEMETTLPRWSSISNTPSRERVHRVLPMMIGGQSIQPVVSLSRTMVDVNNLHTDTSPNNNLSHNFLETDPLPTQVLQDLYIPLTRIDANGLPLNNMYVNPSARDAHMNNSAQDLDLDDSGEQSLHESQNVSEPEPFDDTQRLDVVEEAVEPEDEVQPSPKPTENPLEGPSWMLDGQRKNYKTKNGAKLELDSTTECDGPQGRSLARPSTSKHRANTECEWEFSPTVRQRKRSSSPTASPPTPHAYSPRPTVRKSRYSGNGRILKVLVSKLRLEEADVSPAKRPTLNIPYSMPARSPDTRESSDNSLTKRYVIDHLSVDRQARGTSPTTSPTKRQQKNKSPSRRESKDRSPMRRQSRDRSPSSRLSRDMRLLSFDAPSPNGATTSHVVISESSRNVEAGGSGEPVVACGVGKHEGRISRDSKHNDRSIREIKRERHTGCEDGLVGGSSRDSDSGSGSDLATEGRTRRSRKAVTYKEKPLNRKMRR